MATLKAILRTLLSDAKQNPCAAQVKALPRGLWVGVRVDDAADRQLKLERRGAYPSAQEWRTVLDHWPEALPEPRPMFTQHKTGPRYALVGRWKTAQAELVS